jgi:phage tail-like protein
MAGDMPGASDWPLPRMHFQVQFGDSASGEFSEVSGLDVESEVIEYRHSDAPHYATIKMPGLLKRSNITLKRGNMTAGDGVWDWVMAIKMNTLARQQVTITLLDENGMPAMGWRLTNAYLSKIEMPPLEADEDRIVIERIEIAHEGIEILNP